MNAPVNVDPREDAWSIPLDRIDVSQPGLYQDDIWEPYFERLRRDDPVHWCENGMYGSFWSVTKYKDIMQVDTSQKTYSSDAMMGGIVLRDTPMDFRRPSFISMDQPRHDEQRKVVSPVVAPMNLQRLSATIRERTQHVLDGLPRGETFDWVDRVSIELTTQMLATLFDFPFEERRTLTWWSNVATVNTRAGTEIELSPKEFSLLEFFLRNSGSVLTRSQIIEAVWDFAYDGGSNVVDQYVKYLRGKIDVPFGRHDIETVRGMGYRLRAAGGG